MIKKYFDLIVSLMRRQEELTYTLVANIVESQKKQKCCHYKDEHKVTYFQHMYISFRCFLYFLPVVLFLILHMFVPNFKCHYATDKVKNFDTFYSKILSKFKKVSGEPALFDNDALDL